MEMWLMKNRIKSLLKIESKLCKCENCKGYFDSSIAKKVGSVKIICVPKLYFCSSMCKEEWFDKYSK